MNYSAGRPASQLALLVVVSAVVLGGCRAGMPLRELVRPTTPSEQYAQSLRDARLDQTALGEAWFAAGARALLHPVHVTLPFSEIAYLPSDEPEAIGYRVELRRGQRFTMEVVLETAEPARLFLDAFELPATGSPRPVESAVSESLHLAFDPPRDGTYLVRLQPELLRGGRYRIEQRITASLAFPVAGLDSRAVASFFGASRDRGLRQHDGIDIFAPRGTAVLSATDGRVTRVDTTGRGGRVVWVSDSSRGKSLYYAHLDEQHVTAGQRVRAGDFLGTVGNTGNARGTAPHLHFGIYRRGQGAVDPFPYVHEPPVASGPVTASLDPLGTWSRTTSTYRLRAGASTASPILSELPGHTVLRVEAATTDWYRVALPDGTRGFMNARGVQPLEEPVRQHRPSASAVVRERPTPIATQITSIGPGADVPVLGTYESYLLVRTPDGREGWTLHE